MTCISQITPAFVREAYNLLRQSIIHVEKDDIGLDEEEEVPAEVDRAMANMELDEAQAGHAQLQIEHSAPKPKAKAAVSYQKYMGIMALVLGKLDTVERSTGNGMKTSELVQWYLEETEGNLNSVEELEAEQVLIVKVLRRLKKVCTT